MINPKSHPPEQLYLIQRAVNAMECLPLEAVKGIAKFCEGLVVAFERIEREGYDDLP